MKKKSVDKDSGDTEIKENFILVIGGILLVIGGIVVGLGLSGWIQC